MRESIPVSLSELFLLVEQGLDGSGSSGEFTYTCSSSYISSSGQGIGRAVSHGFAVSWIHPVCHCVYMHTKCA